MHHDGRGAVPRDIRVLPGQWLVAGLLVSGAGVAVLLAGAQLGIDVNALSDRLIAGAGLVTIAAWIGLRTPMSPVLRVARDGIEYLGLFAAICLLGAIASYPVAADSHGFADASMERIDRALRFDWIGLYRLVAGHPLLQQGESIAYHSIFATPVLILLFFAATGRRGAARLFIASFWLAAVLTLALFPIAPAEGPLAFLWHRHIPYMPASALYQAELIPMLRQHALHSLSATTLHGLVCAPSFHTASAVLFIGAAWPYRRLAALVVPINLAMLLATPIEGTHYLIDMILGAIVAIVAMAIVRAALGMMAPPPGEVRDFTEVVRRLRTRELERVYLNERHPGPRANAMADEIGRRRLID